MALFISEDSNARNWVFNADTGPFITFDEAKKAIGCEAIEFLQLGDGTTLLMDMEARFKTEPKVNKWASELASRKLKLHKPMQILGHVIHCEMSEVK